MSIDQNADVRAIVDRIAATPGCTVSPPCGLPTIRDDEVLPQDLMEFYLICGGAQLFADADFSIEIVPPKLFVRSNPVVAGVEASDDISDSWYVIACGGSEEVVSIDCSPSRLGRCYDSFWDRHAVAGSCAIVAMSFVELLVELYRSEGEDWYWLQADWHAYRDAYDP